MVLWGSHRALFSGSILGTRGAHMEPHPLDDSSGLVVLAKSPIPGMIQAHRELYLLDDLGLAKMAIAETHW